MRMIKVCLLLGFVLATQFLSAQKSRGEQADTSKKEVKEETAPQDIYTVVEDMPEFPGGDKAMYKFIAVNLKYPKKAIEADVQGRVVVKFVVNTDGKIMDAKVLKGIGHGCDEEALRVINSMPNWKPGKQRGKPVLVYYTIPIVFKLM